MKLLGAIAGFVLVAVFVFYPVFTSGKIPLPSDTLVGLYHPFRDFYSPDYPQGMPFKNFLITDPIRQQYPFRYLAVDGLKNLQLPLWNPYNFAGTPLLANFQSAPFYPLNLLYTALAFPIAWSAQVFLQPVLAGIFTYFYLRRLGVSKLAGFFGGLTFALSGFSVSWMEWNTIGHTALWLPLTLLSVEKILFQFNNSENSKFKIQIAKLQFKVQKYIFWSLIFLFSLSSSLFAGHLQTFFYLFVFSFVYFLARWIQFGKNKKALTLFVFCYLLFAVITFVQWLPTLQLIEYSGRTVDRLWQEPGWFIPYSHLVQFIAPDFFGNPATLNYWGVWNYGELVGYAGIVPLVMALFAALTLRRKAVLLFTAVILASLIFALPNPISELPFFFSLPFLSTAQPTRLIFLISFSLAVLAGLGLNHFQKTQKKFVYPAVIVGMIFVLLWFVSYSNIPLNTSPENLSVARRNLFLPSAVFIAVLIGWVLSFIIKTKKYILVLSLVLVSLTIFDLGRFSQKFLPFTDPEYLFPETQTLEFLSEQTGIFRIMSVDDRILPPNTSIMYGLQTVDGYDPLYLLRYAELIAASERNEPNVSPPFGFNRIITPKRFDSRIIDLLGVKYIVSLSDIKLQGLSLVFEEGQTKVYENQNALPRAFSIQTLLPVSSKELAIKGLFENQERLDKVAVVEEYSGQTNFEKADVEIETYSPNKVTLKVSSESRSFVVFTDTYYPTWKARIGKENLPVYLTDYNFRGVSLPPGEHVVEFYSTLF